jgi:hypothetical protein
VTVRRVALTSVLRRKLSGEGRRNGLEDLLSRRRSLRARAAWPRRSEQVLRADDEVLDDEDTVCLPDLVDGHFGKDETPTVEMPVAALDAAGAEGHQPLPPVVRQHEAVSRPSTSPA